MFMESFKYYKSKSNPPDLSQVIDFDLPIDKKIAEPVNLQNATHVSQHLGLTATKEWHVYRLVENPGLLFIRNPFTCHGQRYWIARCLRDYPKPPHEKNKFNHTKTSAASPDWWSSISASETHAIERARLKTALRWVTLGYHHDWDTKVYTEQKRHEFPRDLATLTAYVAQVLGFPEYSAEAAIVNYYPQGTTLAGHTDHSEKNLDAPLFSYSFGQSAIFLIGGQTADTRPSAVFLKSGDIAVMSRESRLSYHAVPRILMGSADCWMFEADSSDERDCELKSESKRRKVERHDGELEFELWSSIKDDTNWRAFDSYAQDCRININVRQVLYAGQSSL